MSIILKVVYLHHVSFNFLFMNYTFKVFGKDSKRTYRTYGICVRMAKRHAEKCLKNSYLGIEPISIFRDGKIFDHFYYLHFKG